MTQQPSPEGFDALKTIISALQQLEAEEQMRVLESAAHFLGVGQVQRQPPGALDKEVSEGAAPSATFSESAGMAPKEFLLDKHPRTDVERVACLAYYLTHYRDTPHFKTLDLSKLNTEAAQPKFSNASVTVNNAVKRRYLVPATKGKRQLSAIGEQFVQALPDRDRAKAVMAKMRPKTNTKSRKKKTRKKVSSSGEQP